MHISKKLFNRISGDTLRSLSWMGSALLQLVSSIKNWFVRSHSPAIEAVKTLITGVGAVLGVGLGVMIVSFGLLLLQALIGPIGLAWCGLVCMGLAVCFLVGMISRS